MPIATAARESQLLETVDTLLNARRTNQPIQDLPPALQPATVDEAYFIQDKLAQAYGDIGGYKIGAPTPDATPAFAPMPRVWLSHAGSDRSTHFHRYRGIEAEIAFLVGQDIPPRDTPYALEEILPRIASCHPAIEILESAFVDPDQASPLAKLADLSTHGGFIAGPACPGWENVDFSQERATLAIDGIVRVERTGSNTAGNLLRLLPFLANQGAARTGGLRAGQWITTGSWTGNTLATAGSTADVHFSTIGRVSVRFA
jgi:2-keto-4-pentenoate hydratase